MGVFIVCGVRVSVRQMLEWSAKANPTGDKQLIIGNVGLASANQARGGLVIGNLGLFGTLLT